MSMDDLFPDTNTSTPEQRDEWARLVEKSLGKETTEMIPDPKEVVRYLCILQDGEPRQGPDTLGEFITKTFHAEVYSQSFQLLLYGDRE